MLKITIPLGEDDTMPVCEISPTVKERLTSRRFCRSPEVLRAQASIPSPTDQVTSPQAKAVQAKARKHLDAVAFRMKRRRSHEDEFKQKILAKEAEAEDRAQQHILKILEKAKSHNETISERVSRKLSFEASHRESLARKLANDMECAEARRAKRVQMIVQRNAQRSSAAYVIGRAAKANAEEKAHAATSAVLAAAMPPPGSNAVADQVKSVFDARNACSALLAQIEARLWRVPSASSPPEGDGQSFEDLTLWMRSSETIEHVRRCLVILGVGPSPTQRVDLPRIVLALLCMAIDAKRIFDVTVKEDKIMRREARRFTSKLKAALRCVVAADNATEKGGAGTIEESAIEKDKKEMEEEPFAESLHRASRFYKAWSAHDRPVTLEQLMAAVVAESARQRERGVNPSEPPEAMLAQIRGVGGQEAEAEARRRFAGAWSRMTTSAQLEETVKAIAERAFWDAVSEKVAGGEYDALFSILGEMQQAMRALIAHSPRAVEELADKFDADWLKRRADNGALDVASVIGLMRYIARTIAEWQAPADDEEARAWLRSTEEMLCAQEGSEDLAGFISAHLVTFLRGANERLGRVYQRTIEFMEQHNAAARQEQEPSSSSSEVGGLGQQD